MDFLLKFKANVVGLRTSPSHRGSLRLLVQVLR